MTFEEEMQDYISFFNDYYVKEEPTKMVRKVLYVKEKSRWRRITFVDKYVFWVEV